MHRLHRAAALAAAAVATALTAAPAFAVQAHDPGRPFFDVRAGERASVPAATDRARDALAQRLGTEAAVSSDRTTGGIRAIGRTDGFLTAASDDDAAAVALGYVRDHPVVFGLDAGDLAALRLLSRSTSGDGVTHLTWMQTSAGVPAYDSVLNANVTADGKLLSIGGAPSADLSIAGATPALTASQALRIAQQDVGGAPGLPRADARPGVERRTTFADGDAARLVAFADPGGDRLAWRVTVAGEAPYVYDVVVDAQSGALLARNSLTDFAAAQVYDSQPGEGAAHAVDLASWLGDTQGARRLFGPNAYAYADVDGANGFSSTAENIAAVGGDWSFPLTQVTPGAAQRCSALGGVCSWDGVSRPASEPTNRSQTTTQLFYYVNTFHDWLAQQPIGFDAGSRNFEGGDRVLAEADDSSGINNANMSTPPDGQSPRMQMYLFSSPFPAVNSGDDASVVYHEYTHGLSNRLVAGGTGSQLALQQGGAMGEGWSDWYAFDYLVARGFAVDSAADGDIAVGAYVTGNLLTGIRSEALDCPVGSAALACAGTATSGSGGFTLADMGRVGAYGSGLPRFEVHDDGEIWAQTLWDLRRAVGATTARGLITNGMRLTTVDNPSFLDSRDAILQADLATGGRDHDAIWQVFATRGMGYGASVTDPNATRATASFALPALTSASRPALDDAAPIGDGDGVAEPGEAVRLSVQLDNPAAIALTNVRATLSGPPGVVVGASRAGYGTIAAGGRAAGATPFAVTLPAAAQCGAAIALTLNVSSDQGAIALPLTLPVGGGWEPLAAASGLSIAIPDDAPGTGATSTLTVAAGRAIAGLRVTLSIAHTYGNDLRALLTSPSGTTVELLSRPGAWNSAFDGFDGVVLDDGASTSIQALPSGNLPAISGRFRPDEPLAVLDGEPRGGTWTLRATDSVAGDVGAIRGWSLEAGQPACSTTAPALPAAATGDASGLAATTATLGGTVDAAGSATAYAFEYGTTVAYGAVTPAASAGAGSGAAARSAVVGDLAASTTYHFRIVALRGGTVVALGDDRSFTTPAAPSGGGGGGGGGTPDPGAGGTPGGGGGGTPGGGTTPPAGGTPTPPAGGGTPTPPRAAATAVGALPPKLTLNARNAFALTFRAAPAGASGTVRFALPKQRRRAAIGFAAPFTVSSRGTVSVTVTLRGSALRRLRQLRSARTAVTIVLGGRTFRRTLTLKPAPPRRQRR